MANSSETENRHHLIDDGLYAIDLRGTDSAKMQALRQQAIREGISLARLFARLVDEASARLLSGREACDPDGQAAHAAGMDHAA